MNLSAVIASSVAPALGAPSPSNLVHWPADEPYEIASTLADMLASDPYGCFVEFAGSASLSSLTNSFTLPEHAGTLAVFADGVALEESTVEELEAYSPRWRQDEGNAAERFIFDSSLRVLTIHPKLSAGRPDQTLTFLRVTAPADITAGSPTVAVPPVLQELFAAYLLADLRGREGMGRMPEVAQSLRSFSDVLLQVVQVYWGRKP